MITNKNAATLARAMATYIRAHGFSPMYSDRNGCGCFAHAARQVNGSAYLPYPLMNTICAVIGAQNLMPEALRATGWTLGQTDDAAAACDIAADLLTP